MLRAVAQQRRLFHRPQPLAHRREPLGQPGEVGPVIDHRALPFEPVEGRLHPAADHPHLPAEIGRQSLHRRSQRREGRARIVVRRVGLGELRV
ncbi:hypothetical protein Y590_25855 (plasmid) [Methylobacterium sp. AMS5]|nr:hypothetical protein [Methylobacterium sp. AMS5]AMB48401.1 hypothetical protein Y590_25855 [Methylobacterium sp. AMS5]